MIENIKGIGAKKTILVRNEEENKLKNLFETELVFTIYEAKVWNSILCSCGSLQRDKTSDVWKVIL